MACFLFYGEDLYSLRKKVYFWREEFKKKHGGDINLEILEGKTLTPETFRSVIQTVPFLGEKRLVVIKNLITEGNRETLETVHELLEKCPDFCVLVFIEEEPPDMRTKLFKKLQKCAAVEEFRLKTGGQLIALIFKICKERGVEIEENAALFLSELTGGDLYRLENEIHKLSHYVGEKNRPITKGDIRLLVDTTVDTSIFRLTDALGNGDMKRSLEILHDLMNSGETLHHILYMIVRQFRIIAQVKDLLGQGMKRSIIASKIGEKPFVVGIAMNQAQNFSQEKLQKIYQALLDIDRKLKTGGIKIFAGDERAFLLAVDKFILDACA